jgi:hypothetical protein
MQSRSRSTRRPGRPLAFAAVFTVLVSQLSLGSCKDALPPPVVVTDSFPGDYVLRTVNGFPLPQITYEDADSVEQITYGLVTLRSDSTFLDSTQVQIIRDGVATTVSHVAHGFIRHVSGTITFYITDDGGGAYTMTIDDNVLTQSFPAAPGVPDNVLVYRK